MKRYIFSSLLFLLGLALASCSTSQSAGQTGNDQRRAGQDTIEATGAFTLADYLSRVPGVYFDGYNISIRGAGPPLYIVDGVWIGRSYFAAADAVSINDIASVEVLRSPSEKAMYGREGANGVIVIHTKGANPDAGKYQ